MEDASLSREMLGWEINKIFILFTEEVSKTIKFEAITPHSLSSAIALNFHKEKNFLFKTYYFLASGLALGTNKFTQLTTSTSVRYPSLCSLFLDERLAQHPVEVPNLFPSRRLLSHFRIFVVDI